MKSLFLLKMLIKNLILILKTQDPPAPHNQRYIFHGLLYKQKSEMREIELMCEKMSLQIKVWVQLLPTYSFRKGYKIVLSD